jgi:hypothetical protein
MIELRTILSNSYLLIYRLYHKMIKEPKPANAFILFMKHRSKTLNEQSLENYKPPEPKPRKRNKKETGKKTEDEKETILINKKTGDEVNDESISENRSTNPSSLTMSSKVSESNASERGNYYHIN